MSVVKAFGVILVALILYAVAFVTIDMYKGGRK